MRHQFGGPWTERKLAILRKYLDAYTTALKNTDFELVYVDAFAGTGSRVARTTDKGMMGLLEIYDFDEILAGSARLALEITDRPFDRLLFIDQKRSHISALRELVESNFPDRQQAVTLKHGDANVEILEFCRKTDWQRCRAVLFLDPYGMETDWTTIEAVAETRAIDLWYLVPTGMGLNRLMTRTGQMDRSWEERLTRNLGTGLWRDYFYTEVSQGDLFDADASRVKRVYDDTRAQEFVLGRLRELFEGGVASSAVPLQNSRGQTMFILTFACGNRRAHQAVKIANHLVKRWKELGAPHGSV